MKGPVLNLPNCISLARVPLGLAACVLVWQKALVPAAVAIFLAVFSDWIDGIIARKTGSVSDWGKIFDPLADKVFANVLLVYLAARHPDWVPLWVVLLLIAREFAVQGFRSLAPCVGVVIGTGQLNKLKLVFQLVACGTAFYACLVAKYWFEQLAQLPVEVDVAVGDI